MSDSINTQLLESVAETIDELNGVAERNTSHPAGIDKQAQGLIDQLTDLMDKNDLEGLYEAHRAIRYDLLRLGQYEAEQEALEQESTDVY